MAKIRFSDPKDPKSKIKIIHIKDLDRYKIYLKFSILINLIMGLYLLTTLK